MPANGLATLSVNSIEELSKVTGIGYFGYSGCRGETFLSYYMSLLVLLLILVKPEAMLISYVSYCIGIS